jgi:hypothetical protein
MYMILRTTGGDLLLDSADISRVQEAHVEEYTEICLKNGTTIQVMDSLSQIVKALQTHHCVETVTPMGSPEAPKPLFIGQGVAEWGEAPTGDNIDAAVPGVGRTRVVVRDNDGHVLSQWETDDLGHRPTS